jgi:Cdc6-like AAA superfamily ATPase
MLGNSNAAKASDRRQWRKTPVQERIVLANNLLVLHPRFREAVNVLKRCHESKSSGGEPHCGAILGSSGTGKTSVVDHYIRKHPREETETATHQSVLKVTLQPDARPKGIASDILMALEDPAWGSGTVQTLTNRAVKLL